MSKPKLIEVTGPHGPEVVVEGSPEHKNLLRFMSQPAPSSREDLIRELRGRLGVLTLAVLQEDWAEARQIACQVKVTFGDGGPMARIPWVEG